MDILNEMHYKSVAENERNLRFWSDYLQNLKSLDFTMYSDKLKVPILVPIGSRILFRGELKHTNEVTVALGADYFVKCSLKQADVLRQHRIKGAQEKFDIYNKEKEYLLNQINFTKQNIPENQGQEIIEYHTDEEDKTWREKHRKNVTQYMQKRGKEKVIEKPAAEITDEELWERLEELELQEELEDELNTMNNNDISLHTLRENKKDSFVIKEKDLIIKNTETEPIVNKDKDKAEKEMRNKKVTFEAKAPEQPSKLDLLQQVIDRQNELGEKLQELKNREKTQAKSEQDLMARLDELEQLDELEDEMERIEDIIENEDIEESEEEDYISDSAKLQRRVSFVDEDNSETLNLTFKHSEIEPDNVPYDPEKGIQRPSDIYQAQSHLFKSGTTSILKKTKYAADDELPEMLRKEPIVKVEKDSTKQVVEPASASHDDVVPQTIIVKDIVEKMGEDDKKLQTEAKPMSLFKKKRMQNKSK